MAQNPTSVTGFLARFPGSCPICYGAIHVGHRITRTADRKGKPAYRHISCGAHPGHQPTKVVDVARRLVDAMKATPQT